MLCVKAKISCFCLGFLLLWGLVSFCSGAENTQSGEDEAAWQELSVERNRFWKDVEDSPALVERSAWPLIRGLKFFIQYYPNSQHVPEAYYMLGQAYSSIGYNAEAAAHWRTVVRYYPHSKWAGPALTELVKQLEETGNRRKILDFYREILRQFPDSSAAVMARVLLAEDALKQGRIDLVNLTIQKLEKIPSIELNVPEFLRLKALIAEREGQYAKAREYLLHYLNLIKSRRLRASALFRIAEDYRAQGRYLEARKYYALVKRDFGSEPEALFARFRLAQLEDRARGRLSVYVSSALKPEDMPETARLYARILKEFPSHPLAQEVQFEFMQLRMKQAKYLDALKLGYDFLKRLPESVYAEKVKKLSLEALGMLEKHRQTVPVLMETVKFGLPIIKSATRNHVLDSAIEQAMPGIWLKMMKQMVGHGMNKQALEQYREFASVYGEDKDRNREYMAEARESAANALRALDAAFMKGEMWTGLINYHFEWKAMMDDLALASHWYALARCWDALECPDAALRAYFHAWKLGPSDKIKCPLLNNWADCAIRAGDDVSASATLQIFDSECPDRAFTPEGLTLKARLEVLRGRWREATALYRDAVREGGGFFSRKGLLEGLIMTGEWRTAATLRDHIWEKVRDDEKRRLLALWGDEAYRLQEYGIALDAYERLLALEPEDPAVAWKLARTRQLDGDVNTAMEEFKALSQADSPLWAEAADGVLKNRKFWEGVPEELK